MVIEKERNPLGEMNVHDYYAEGCDETSVIIIPGDDDEEPLPQPLVKTDFEFAPELKISESIVPEPMVEDGSQTVDELMQKTEEPAPGAALLQPIDGTGDTFDVWESGSAKDDTEIVVEC
jgi:hypothetical protein